MDREQKTLNLGFQLDTGEKKEIQFSGVLAYKITDIYSQNVVSRLLLSSAGNIDDPTLDHCLSLIHDRHAAGQPKFPQPIKADILRQDLLLFYMEPSVGAEAAVIARHIQIS